ncbi:MAG: ATP-binding protein [Methylococcaceae bacterium]
MQQEITSLIDSRREGDYWDFKEQHHDNKASLLHDIICLANTITKGHKYLIYGVSDPSTGCEIKGVKPENRRTQADIIDFIRSMAFAGEIRPEIELRTLNVSGVTGKEIDVITIFDHPNKPYYLNKEFRDQGKVIMANHIYCRTLDTNTPINSSADLRRVEAMWRERFGLDLQPAQRIVELLKHPEDWEKDIGNKDVAYHKFHPEYQIKFGEVREFTDVYSYFYINEKSFIGDASFRYLSTPLFMLPYIYCNEMRIELAVPTNGHIQIGSREIWYQYYEIDGRSGAFLHFLTDGTYNFNSRMSEGAFVLYRDSAQRESFEKYASQNILELDKIQESCLGKMHDQKIQKANQNFLFKPIEMIKLNTLFKSWSCEKS